MALTCSDSDTETLFIRGDPKNGQTLYSLQLFSEAEAWVNLCKCIEPCKGIQYPRCPTRGSRFFYSTDTDAIDAILERLFQYSMRNFWLCCTNIEFDVAMITPALNRIGKIPRVVYNGSRILWGDVKDENRHGVKIVDTMNLLNRLSVEKLGKLLGLPKIERPDYLGRREPKTDAEREYFMRYAVRDAEISYRAVKWLRDELDNLRATLPSLTLAQFRRSCPQLTGWDRAYWRLGDYDRELMRDSYHGGRVEAIGRGYFSQGRKVYNYDVRSLYPSVMVKGDYPDPLSELRRCIEGDLGKEGVADVTIEQEAYLPPLCVKKVCADGDKRLLFPNGRFRGTFTYPELRYLEDKGYGSILKWHHAIEYREKMQDFRDFISGLFEKRLGYLKTKDAREVIYKLLMNSFYGKFGQSAKSVEYELDSGQNKIRIYRPCKKCGKALTHPLATDEAYTQRTLCKACNMPEEDCVCLPIRVEGFTQHYMLCSYVTAYGRLRLHELGMSYGGRDILYMDTDSLFSQRSDYALGAGLGDLSIKNPSKDCKHRDSEICSKCGDLFALFIRAKFYVLGDIVRCKGAFWKGLSTDFLMMIAEAGEATIPVKHLSRLRESAKRDLMPFSEINAPKVFKTESDFKRVYDSGLYKDKLITRNTLSEAVRIEEND